MAKEYVSAKARAGGKTVVTVSIVDGLLSAKAEAVTFVSDIERATKAARAQAREVMERLKRALEAEEVAA